ncbi:unnamed protein product [Trifolium pratense]|uniref:Uncharacterized protein n=1 Tax=Trifolium pratense TaxID=57577 RepID=A0ACB0KML4_TRIPR|nr:unnamed protein product [Trifolium pratense]
MENDIPLILCKLERIFPPALFDSMEHVVVHLAYEARLGGPVQYRWMYPFERFMGYAKRAVKNKARVEGSICATYLHHETIYFCSHYFKDTLSSSHIRNETETSRPVRIHPLNMSIFSLPGRNGGGEKVLYPGDKVLYSAHVHLLINCNEVEPYLQMFLTQHTSAQINSQFPAWFKEYMYQQTPATRVIQHLRNLSDGPKSTVKQWHTYFVNGYRFETHSWSEGKTTVNSGVCMKGVTENGEGDFYGVIENIFEIEYNYLDYKKTVVLFYCKWFDPSNRGTRYDSKTNTVDIKMNKHYPLYDPFAMAHNVRQVHYVPYPSTTRDKRGWCAAITSKPRGLIEKNEIDEREDEPYQEDEMSNVDDVIAVETFNQLCVQEEAEEVPSDGDVDEEDVEANGDDEGSDDEDVSDWDDN